MKSLNPRVQDCEEFLEKGTIISLKVGISPKTGKPTFLPQFVNDDNLLDRDGRQADSFRVFIPDREVEWQKGERWNVEVQSWNISNKITRDNRRHVHIYVRVIQREESTVEEIDWEEKKLVVRKVSGDCIVSETRLPVMEQEKWFRKNRDFACLVRFYKSGDRTVKCLIVQTFSRIEYVNYLARGLKRLSLISLAKAYEKLPPLPESATLF